MVDTDIGLMYDQLIEYLISKKAYYTDVNTPDSEFNDYMDFDLTSAVDTIQRQMKAIPNIGEAATIRGYRNMRSAEAEYGIRLMSRSDYWADAIEEEQDNIDKWKFNKKITYLTMNGKDAGA